MNNESEIRFTSNNINKFNIISKVSSLNNNLKCSICLLNEETLKKEENLHNQNNKNVNELERSVNPLIVNNNYIFPCLCSKSFHKRCLLDFIIANMIFKCEKCNVRYPFEILKQTNEFNKFTFIIKSAIFLIIHVLLTIISILFFINNFNFTYKFIIWSKFMGSLIFFINIFLLFYSIGYIRKKGRKIIYKPTLSLKSKNIEEDESGIDNKKGKIISEYLKSKYECDELNLIERKRNDLIFKEIFLKQQNKINSILNEDWSNHKVNKFVNKDISYDYTHLELDEDEFIFDNDNSSKSFLVKSATSFVSTNTNNKSFNRLTNISTKYSNKLIKNNVPVPNPAISSNPNIRKLLPKNNSVGLVINNSLSARKRNSLNIIRNEPINRIKKTSTISFNSEDLKSNEKLLLNYSINKANKLNNYNLNGSLEVTSFKRLFRKKSMTNKDKNKPNFDTHINLSPINSVKSSNIVEVLDNHYLILNENITKTKRHSQDIISKTKRHSQELISKTKRHSQANDLRKVYDSILNVAFDDANSGNLGNNIV